ncbi:MAG TPA: heavy-metal-associated domain-containing protein [Solirubrobacteraceae bacterium]|jgi:copper chaperone CopZ
MTTTYSVPEMSCGHCKAAITEEITQLDGIQAVDVDLDAKLVRVTGHADPVAVVAAIDAAGYEAVAA